MKFSVGVIIFFLALIALVAEVILYFMFGIGAAFSGETSAIGGIAAFFVWLMIVTVVAGIAAPISGAIESISKKINLGMYIFVSITGLAAVGAGVLLLVSQALLSRVRTESASAIGNAPKSNRQGWQVTEETSQMDGSKTVVLALDAENEIKGWLKSTRPALVIRCRERKIDVYANLGVAANPEVGRYNEYTVRIKLDDQPAVRQRWGSSTDNEALFSRNGAALAGQISNAKKMLLEFTPFNASPATVQFNVEGLEKHLPKVRSACTAGRN